MTRKTALKLSGVLMGGLLLLGTVYGLVFMPKLTPKEPMGLPVPTNPPGVEFWHFKAAQNTITALFDQPMAAAQTLDPLLRFDPPLQGAINWRTPRVLEFHSEAFQLSTPYRVILDAGLKAQNGSVSSEVFQFEFKTPSLEVVSVSPSPLAVGVGEKAEIQVTFNQPVELNSVKPGTNALLFPSNDLEAEKNPREDGFFNTEVTYGFDTAGNIDRHVLTFKPTFPYQPEQDHRFLLKRLLPVQGSISMEHDFELHFKTGSPGLAKPTMAWGEAESPVIFKLQRGATAPDTLTLELCTVSRAAFLEVTQRFGWQNYSCADPQKSNAEWEEKDNEITLNLNDLFEEPLKKGPYFLSVKNGEEEKLTQTFVISETKLFLRRSGNDLLIWAVDQTTGVPVKEVSLTIFSYSGEKLAEGMTDGDGLYELKEKAESGFYVVGETSTRWAFASDLSLGGGEARPRLYWVMDQAAHLPGDTIRFQGWIRWVQGQALTLPQKTRIVLTWMDPSGETLYDLTPTLGRFGTFYGTWDIPKTLPPGAYAIKAEIVQPEGIFVYDYPVTLLDPAAPSTASVQKEVTVPKRTQKESIQLSPAALWIRAGEPWEVDLEARSQTGAMTEGKKIKLRLEGNDWSLKKNVTSKSAPERLVFEIPREAEGKITLTAESQDKKGDPLESHTALYVVGETLHPEEPQILADQSEYLVGGKANLLLISPPEIPLLLTYEQAGFSHQEVLKLESPFKPLEILIEEAMLPELTVNLSYFDPPARRFKTQSLVLPISLREKAIQIKVAHQWRDSTDGKELALEVDTSDYQGRPLPSQLTLFVTAGKKDPENPLDYFYKNDSQGNFSDKNFYWKSGLKTSENGRGVFALLLPSDFTKGTLSLIASSNLDRFGNTEIPLISDKPFSLTPLLPAFAWAGDKLSLGVDLLNLQSQEIKTTVELIGEGLDMKTNASRFFTLKPQENKEIKWKAAILPPQKSRIPLAFRTPETFVSVSLPIFPQASPLLFHSVDEVIDALAAGSVSGEELQSFELDHGGYRLTRSAKEADPLWTAYALLFTRRATPQTYALLWKALKEETGLNDEERIFTLWTLTEAGEFDTRLTLDFLQKYTELSQASQGFLLLTLYNLIQAGQKSLEPFSERLKSEIASAVTQDGAMSYVKNPKTTSVILLALNRVSPDNPLLEGLVNYLTTQDPEFFRSLALQDYQQSHPDTVLSINPPEPPESPLQNQSIVVTQTFESDSFKKGEIVQGKLYFVIPRLLRYAKVEVPLPAGLKPLEFEPKIENSFYQMYPDRLVMLAPELPAGVYEISYLLEAAHAGHFYQPPARVYSIISEQDYGSTPEGFIEVEE